MSPADPNASSAAPAQTKRALELLRARFAGRDDLYLQERGTKAFWCHETVTEQVLLAHLNGDIRIGLATDPARALYVTSDFDGKQRAGGFQAALAEAQAYLAVVEADAGLATLLERSRSGVGFHVWIFFDPESPPTLDEARAFVVRALQSAGLPHDGDEGKGHAGIFPHPHGDKGVGRSPFLPWSGLLREASGGVFVDANGERLADQIGALAGARLVTRSELLRATEQLGESPHLGTTPLVSGVTELSSDPRLSVVEDLSDPQAVGGSRHDALRGQIMRWRNLLSIAQTRILAFAVAGRWGMLEENRGGEIENLVVGAYLKAARKVDTQAEIESRSAEELWIPSTLAGVVEPTSGAVDYIVDGFLPRGETSIMGAGWKSGKTLATYSLALQAAAGYPVFGFYAVSQPVRVLVVQAEMPSREDDRRFRRLALGNGMHTGEVVSLVQSGMLTVYNRPPVDLVQNPGKFQEICRTHDAELIIVDSIIATFCGADINDNAEVRRVFRAAFASLTSEGRTILCLHHKRKKVSGARPDEDDRHALLGAQAWGAAAGRIYALESIADDGGDRLRGFKCRLSLVGSWTPEDFRDAVVEIRDTPDGGTTVRLLAEADQIKRGGINRTQRVGIALAELVRVRRAVDRQGALTEVMGDLGVKKTVAEDGLSYARSKRWIAARPIEGTKNRHELIPGEALDEAVFNA